ncbi:hypothetical protein FACS189485_17100 [Spirochaetia bacterium]|nr:hypothetical protein FACS189485_17100 [Spirochaetia bacterium]
MIQKKGRHPAGNLDNGINGKWYLEYSTITQKMQAARMNNTIKARLGEYLGAKGIEINEHGFIKCLEHDDHTPSCQVNADYLYCPLQGNTALRAVFNAG